MTIITTTTNRVTEARLRADAGRLLLAIVVDGQIVLDDIELGLVANGQILDGSSVALGVEEREIREQYRARSGKAEGLHDVHHVEHEVSLLDEATGVTWGIVLRAADDGIAFRYVAPEGATEVTLGREKTRIPLAAGSRIWTLDYQTWYETPRFGADLENLAEGHYGFPTLVRNPAGQHVLLSESDIDGRFSGAHPVFDGAALVIEMADESVAVSAGTRLPWRVIHTGSLATIVASTLVDDLAPAADPALADADWIRPGRAAWSWWSSQYSGAYLEHQKRFADYAADRGWEHVLVDCGWDATWMPELVAHASRRGVQVHVWSSWSDLDGEEALRKLALWRSWGVAGIKVDFMESEAQERYRWYDAITAEAVRVGLMINFHGSVFPRGWARTYPNILGYEGIRGAEYYVFYGDPLTAAHNVIQPFTRNVVGAMDYTPVTFSAPQRETSDGHELGMSVVFESGITHFADEVNEYAARPLAEAFLAEVPPVWHETILLGGTPDTEAVLARRNGDRWFLGAIATGAARTIDIDLSPLGLISPESWIITDGVDGLTDAAGSVLSGDTLSVDLAPNGGFVGVLAPALSAIRRSKSRPTRDTVVLSPAVQTIEPGGSTEILSPVGATLRLPAGWGAEQIGSDATASRWRVSAPRDLQPGAVGVIAAEYRHEGDEVPVFGHVHLFAPLTTGEYSLSALPFLSCANEVGPVERDLANGGGDPRDGAEMSIAGVSYKHGLGVSAESHIEFFLDGAGTQFTARLGIDDETPSAQAVARVLCDGTVAAEFELRGGEAATSVVLPIDGVRTLRLEVGSVNAGEAHIDWADATIIVGKN